MKKYDSILDLYVSEYAVKPQIMQPHFDKEHNCVVATDGIQMVIIPKELADWDYSVDEHLKGGFVNYRSVSEKCKTQKLDIPLALEVSTLKEVLSKIPQLPVYEIIECPDCEGFGCPKCSDGWLTTKEQIGTEYDLKHEVLIEKVLFNPNLLSNILKVADMNGHEIIEIQVLQKALTCLFIIGEVEIYIMPMKPIDERSKYDDPPVIHEIRVKQDQKESEVTI